MLCNCTCDLITKVRFLTASLINNGIDLYNLTNDHIYITESNTVSYNKLSNGFITIYEFGSVHNVDVIFEFIDEIKISEIVDKINYFVENDLNYKVIISIKNKLRFDNELQTYGNFNLSFITNKVKK